MRLAENLASIESEGRRLLDSVRRDPGRSIPQYPGWTATDLLSHTASIHGRTALICETSPSERVPSPKLPAGANPMDWYEANLERMLTALRTASPETPLWTLGVPHNIEFWERRMVIETGVHRWDAYQAVGEQDRLTDIVARSGLDEFESMWTRHLGDVDPLRVVAADLAQSWSFGDGEPRAEVTGTASDIYLRLMSRPSTVTLPIDWASAVDGLAPPPKPD